MKLTTLISCTLLQNLKLLLKSSPQSDKVNKALALPIDYSYYNSHEVLLKLR